MTAHLIDAFEASRRGNGAIRPRRARAVDESAGALERVRTDGKFLRHGHEKFWVKGVTYGPFRPNSIGDPLPEPAQVEWDFRHLAEIGANTVRVYHAPPEWLLDTAAEHGLKIFVDAPFAKNRLFLNYKSVMTSGRDAVRQDVRSCKRHPAVLAYIVANEVPPDVVRWLGTKRVERYLDELVDIAKQEDPEGLVTVASFPPTEYLRPQSVDFYTMNVYLHSREKLRAYLERLQNQADEKPLVLGEYGIDTIREGEEEQAKLVTMHVEEVFRAGLAGSCIFSYTDEWFTNGCEITDWAFGLVRRDRTPKLVVPCVAQRWQSDPLPPLERYPRVSVVVCSYNGASTLPGCLRSLGRLNYPDYEVILVDDGSTDATRQIAAQFPEVRYHHQRNHGLSVARNTGMDLATGEIVAYTDSDCFADDDWLYYLVSKLLETGASGVGGPNLLPTDDGPVAACVSASPGTPAHVLIDDQVAEHIPGCNMAFWTERLRAIGGFDPVFTKAGDDVDICWRVQEQGEKIVFSPSAMVWHHRRSTVRAYLKQQRGYGEGEALLKRKHPERFRGFRAESLWKGRIYTRAELGLTIGKSVIHYGRFATAMFQTIYSPPRIWWPLVALSLEWWLVICLLLGLAQVFHPTIAVGKRPPTPDEAFGDTLSAQIMNPLLHLVLAMLGTTLAVSYCVAGQARPPVHQRRWWSRLLIAAMHIAQPVERGFARYRMRFRTIRIPERLRELRRAWEARAGWVLRRRQLDLWSDRGVGREKLLEGLVALAKRNRWNIRIDPGWEPLDITFYGDRWCKLNLTTATDNHGGGRLLTRIRLRLRTTLFYNGLLLMLWYVLMLSWFGVETHANLIEEDGAINFGAVLDHHLVFVLIPVFAVILWRIQSLRRQLNRTVMASILRVADQLGMTVVEAPALLRGRVTEPTAEAVPAASELATPPAPTVSVPAAAEPTAQFPAVPTPIPTPPVVPGPPVTV